MALNSLSSLISAGVLTLNRDSSRARPDVAVAQPSRLVRSSLLPRASIASPAIANLATRRSFQFSGPEPLVGSSQGTERPGPSLALKAYAAALRPFLTLSPDLSALDQAVFVAGPLQFGLPTGFDKSEYINEALFNMTDPMQVPGSPAFGLGGGSFFAALNSYVANVKDPRVGRIPFPMRSGDDRPGTDSLKAAQQASTAESIAAHAAKLTAAQEAYQVAKKAADDEYDKTFAKFKAAHEADDSVRFLDWMSGPFGRSYKDACDERDRRSEELQKVQGQDMSDVARARMTLDSAQARLVGKEGSNMLCALQDLDSAASSAVSTAGNIYRPLYFLSGYDQQSKRWVKDYPVNSTHRQLLSLNLAAASSTSWTSLGFPALSSENSSDTIPGSVLQGTKITVSFTGIASFDIFRGLWDINAFRLVLPALDDNAPSDLRKKLFKAIKVLLAYDCDIVVQLPPDALKALPADRTQIRMLPDLIGDFPVTVRENGEMHARADTDNAYPSLLAILAQQV